MTVASFARNEALDQVLAERVRQDEKWGPSELRPVPSLAILVEEVGEVAEALNRGNMQDVHDELVQVSAVALAMVEGSFRGEVLN